MKGGDKMGREIKMSFAEYHINNTDPDFINKRCDKREERNRLPYKKEISYIINGMYRSIKPKG